jgi:hypothetical protein
LGTVRAARQLWGLLAGKEYSIGIGDRLLVENVARALRPPHRIVAIIQNFVTIWPCSPPHCVVVQRMASPLEALERAVDEVDALEAIFGYDEGGFTVHSAAELAAARSAVEAGAAPDDDWQAPALELELRVEIEAEDEGAAQAARLRCTLPGGYPDSCCAVVSVAMEGVRRATQDALTEQLGQAAAALLGEEAVTELVQQLQEIAPAALAEERAAIAASAAQPAEPVSTAAGGRLDGFGRRWMWAHHSPYRINGQARPDLQRGALSLARRLPQAWIPGNCGGRRRGRELRGVRRLDEDQQQAHAGSAWPGLWPACRAASVLTGVRRAGSR